MALDELAGAKTANCGCWRKNCSLNCGPAWLAPTFGEMNACGGGAKGDISIAPDDGMRPFRPVPGKSDDGAGSGANEGSPNGTTKAGELDSCFWNLILAVGLLGILTQVEGFGSSTS